MLLAESSGATKLNISTLSNWCTRKMPRVSCPAAPASRRKQGEKPGVAQRQALGVEDLLGVQRGERDLGGADEVQLVLGRARRSAARCRAGSRCRTAPARARAPAGSPARSRARAASPAPSARARARASRDRLAGRQSARPRAAPRAPCRSAPPPARGGRAARSRTPAARRPRGPARPRDPPPRSGRAGSAAARARPAAPLRPRPARAPAPSRARPPPASPRSPARAPRPPSADLMRAFASFCSRPQPLQLRQQRPPTRIELDNPIQPRRSLHPATLQRRAHDVGFLADPLEVEHLREPASRPHDYFVERAMFVVGTFSALSPSTSRGTWRLRALRCRRRCSPA